MNKKQEKFISKLKKEHGLILGFQEYEKEIAILERALTMAVEAKCTFENAFFSTLFKNEDLKLVVPKKEQWYKEQAKKEIKMERRKLNVLSLFDGISCGRVALERAGIEVDKYYASEIDKYAIKVSQKNYPNIIQLGDVTQWRSWKIDWSSIDLLIGGSPCQDLSCAGKGAGLEGDRSKLFFYFIEILGHCKRSNPNVLFLLENNNSMSTLNKQRISDFLGCEYTKIDSNLVSAQNRARLYWFNINEGKIPLPADKNILLKDILTEERDWRDCGAWVYNTWGDKTKKEMLYKLSAPKSNTLTTSKSHNRNYYLSEDKGQYTNLNITEWERLQTLPDNYTEGIPNTQRYKCVGNGWTVDVIAHIFSFI